MGYYEQYADEEKSIGLQKDWSQNILGVYLFAVAQVCLHVDYKDFVCKCNRSTGQRYEGTEGPTYFPNMAPLRDKIRPEACRH